FVVDHRYGRARRFGSVLGVDESSQKRRCAELTIVVPGYTAHAAQQKSAVDFHIAPEAASPPQQAGEDPLILLYELESRKRKWNLRAITVDVRKLDQPVRLSDWKAAQQERVEDAEDRGVSADAERQNDDRDRGEPGASPDQPQAVADILQ